MTNITKAQREFLIQKAKLNNGLASVEDAATIFCTDPNTLANAAFHAGAVVGQNHVNISKLAELMKNEIERPNRPMRSPISDMKDGYRMHSPENP